MPSLSRGGGPAVMPKYQRIAAQLRDELDRAARTSGGRLPSERTLAARYEVNRQTVRAALQELRADGLIVTGRRGTRAATPGPRREADGPAYAATAGPAATAASAAPAAPAVPRLAPARPPGGARLTRSRLALVTVPPSLAALLGMGGGERTLVHHHRVYGPAGQTLRHTVTYLCPRTVARTPELAAYLERPAGARAEDLRPLHRWLERAAARGRTSETITMTRTSDPAGAAPVCGLSVRRTVHDGSGRLLAVTDLAFTGWDRLTFHREPEAIGFRVT
ncbi:GntR family transcriptional regulator [Streptomyces sp. NBC_00091]|uniref:GntR family transcriptional regulator n=1 Tax=Streptomyces sp. NBC_00091 TaxID=2975648 RepID=UPI00224F05A2|nr:GntR family transcriptional regulator [Streptomyces sp. NBC_00091]MCX5380664.1 GntR family transcriptional regulator [Streptomyces sp. NBC_00091]